jgi:acetoin utilization deacetylase AcuC-like enzyme
VLGPQLLRQLLQAVLTAGGEDEVVAAVRELAGQLGADARRGAGDEDGGVGSGWRKGHDGHSMQVWTHDRWRFPLPQRHRFPIDKYPLLRERVVADGTVQVADVLEAGPVPWRWLAAVHDRELLERIRTGALTAREQRGLGLPLSPPLVERGRRSVGGTVAAARHALARGLGMNLGGGTHHAGRDFARGFCLFNDVAVALARLRSEGLARRALVVDCDVHQGDGTAQLLGPDPDAFALSLHGARNYPFRRIPSDLDVDLASGTGDERYLLALQQALEFALPRARPDVAFFLAGADPWEGDRLGRLALTKRGLRARDELVLDRLGAAGVPVCVVLAGGYAADVRDTVDINAATAAAVAERLNR